MRRTYIWTQHKWAQHISLGCKLNEIYFAIFQRRSFIAWPLISDTIFCLSLTVSECYIVYWISVAFRRRIFPGLLGLQVLDSSASSLCSPNKLKKVKFNQNSNFFCGGGVIVNLMCILIFICFYFIRANTTLNTKHLPTFYNMFRPSSGDLEYHNLKHTTFRLCYCNSTWWCPKQTAESRNR